MCCSMEWPEGGLPDKVTQDQRLTAGRDKAIWIPNRSRDRQLQSPPGRSMLGILKDPLGGGVGGSNCVSGGRTRRGDIEGATGWDGEMGTFVHYIMDKDRVCSILNELGRHLT